ncbi:uronate isomerase [Weizmannia acidilactici]|uniref:glucuronate isomerase n=1 Tax=Weizmannia acidilactici TaxID=2607726 RepID=UPI00124EDD00|nr:glucuronate isomerase [Weizmannia acidilactici]GER65917.1 uronate isomerase [Weizmannia acidilactici]
MFLDKDFLLTTDFSRKLFHNHAEKMPIIDYHCHLNPKEIYENQNFRDLAQVWINEGNYGDHYKWRLMRANGVPEKYITGDAEPYEKFLKWAETIEKSVGNPLYEWTHLELRRFFGIETILNRQTAPEIWEKANQLLATEDFKPRNLIKNSNVKVVCTTDDPVDDLHYHKLLKESETENGFKVLPAFRPDKVLNIQKEEYADYIHRLSKVSGVSIQNFDDIVDAIQHRVEYFHELGSRLSDHALDTFTYAEATPEELNHIVRKSLSKETLTELEISQYRTALLKELMRIYHEKNWVMQYHIHAYRNLNELMFNKLGPDTGYDALIDENIAESIAKLFASAENENIIPKTILYSLNPNDWFPLVTIMGCFQKDTVQKLQLGCAWWFNDTRSGMRRQLEIFAEESLLPNFVGMLTDSRSFLSYPRHEYFRRVLCELFGEWAERGQIPDDEEQIGKIVEDIAYNNAYRYFGFFD